ncbi:MAG TPA: metalloregulator ArsR/SmtB family transcription factor [Candidatus Cybelea sp.]|nr:metalloregulator ArsR/SmtB family transcription factor [Candidatus Cybelea sp.]
MATTTAPLRLAEESETEGEGVLDAAFFALSDPVRRSILERLDERPQLVSELAEPFAISLQAVSRHIQVLVRAGLVKQERSGRISRCSLEAGPIYAAALWINRYSKYWQGQFDLLAALLTGDEEPKPARPRIGKTTRRKTGKNRKTKEDR